MNHVIVRAFALTLCYLTTFLGLVAITSCGQSTPTNALPKSNSEAVLLEQSVVLLTWEDGDEAKKTAEEERLQQLIRVGGWAVKSTDTKGGVRRRGQFEHTTWTTTVVLERVKRDSVQDDDAAKKRDEEKQETLEREEQEKLKLRRLWSGVKLGMSEALVKDILGDPMLKENSRGVEGYFTWYYDTKKTLSVSFNEKGNVHTWNGPLSATPFPLCPF